ncbi:kinase-like domain-containing protein, partial [Gigaspora rosea]
EKLNLLVLIASDLKLIHAHNVIHCDLHSGNILQNDLYSAYIGDLGLSITVNNVLKAKDGIYGVIPYIAPEVLNNRTYSAASDVYSFAIIAYEVVSGKLAFSDIPHDIRLMHKILHGLRPAIPSHVPKLIAKLIMKCWDTRPNNRPTSEEIYD